MTRFRFDELKSVLTKLQEIVWFCWFYLEGEMHEASQKVLNPRSADDSVDGRSFLVESVAIRNLVL